MRARRRELLTLKLVDFRDDKDEPAFDLEIYRSGKYVGSPDYVFSTRRNPETLALIMAQNAAMKEILGFCPPSRNGKGKRRTV